MSIPILGGNQPADQGTYTEIKDDGPRIRLLYCFNCKSIQELPDFKGHPDDDVLLQILIDEHQSAGVPHAGQLSDIGVKTWSMPEAKKKIIENIRGKFGAGLAELDPDYYTTKATFYDDAMKCFSKHNRPPGACPDYMDSSKRLVPKNTAELRKEFGLMSASKSASTKVYLCQFCPVSTFYHNKKNDANRALD